VNENNFDYGLDYGNDERPARSLQESGREALGSFGKTIADELRRVERSIRSSQPTPPETNQEKGRLNSRQVIAEVQALIDCAGAENRWVEPKEFDARWKDQREKGGQENNVYVEDGYYFKANVRSFHPTWSGYLDRLLIHNTKFPDIPMEITGVTRTGMDWKPAIVCRQQEIRAREKQTTQAEIEEFMKEMGGEQDYAIMHQFHFGDGITMSDARPQNILSDDDGNFYPFDLILKINRGKWE
jgi:hypothetical protein